MTMANDAATRELRLSLADMLQSTDALRADMLRHDDTRLARIAMPFFRRAQVYRAFYDIGPIPIGFTIGHAEDWATVLLEENLEGWHTLAESGVDLSSSDMRLAYGLGFLEATRTMQERFKIIRAPEEIGSFDNLTPEQTRELREARARIVEPIVSITETEPWILRAFVIKSYTLYRAHLTIHRNGTIERRDSMLQEDVPLPLAL